MALKVPYLKKNDARPLQRSISEAAGAMGMSEHQMATAISWWLEKVVGQLSQGKIVRFPCFGAFFPFVFAREGSPRPPTVQMRFQAAVTARSEVAAFCSPGAVRGGNNQYYNYADNHNISRDKDGTKRTYVGLAKVREAILADARAQGFDW